MVLNFNEIHEADIVDAMYLTFMSRAYQQISISPGSGLPNLVKLYPPPLELAW